jgi:hypothetical protein
VGCCYCLGSEPSLGRFVLSDDGGRCRHGCLRFVVRLRVWFRVCGYVGFRGGSLLFAVLREVCWSPVVLTRRSFVLESAGVLVGGLRSVWGRWALVSSSLAAGVVSGALVSPCTVAGCGEAWRTVCGCCAVGTVGGCGPCGAVGSGELAAGVVLAVLAGSCGRWARRVSVVLEAG